MYLMDNTGPAAKPVAEAKRELRSKTKPTPQEFLDAYRAGLRRTKYNGCMIFTERYTDGTVRRYRIQEENPTLCQN